MNLKEERTKIAQFIKTGMVLLSLILLIGSLSWAVPNVISVVASPKRELPIYSVETEKKQVALSFDAAWAKGSLMEPIKYEINII